MSRGFSTIGVGHPRIDAIEKVTGKARYAADFSLPGMLYGKIKRSPHAHARVLSIDAEKALALEGVKAVLTPWDVPRVLHTGAPAPRLGSLRADQLVLTDVARFVGDGVAAVAATTEEIAEAALDLIEVQYEILPAVFTVEEARRPGAPLIHGTEGNLVMPPIIVQAGDVEAGFAEADLVLEATYHTGRPSHCYMEPNACLCYFDESGTLTIWASTQCAFMVRGILSEVLGLPLHKVRVVVKHMGGGFGAKQDLYQHEFVCALLARRTGRPVKMVYSRKEVFMATKTRHPVSITLKQGVKRDGTITARQALYVSNTGGYASHGPGITAVGTIDMTSLYRCNENWRLEGRSVYTNAPIAGAFRGYGAVQSFFALDVQMDELAEMVGMNPLDFRLKNAVGEGDPSPSGHRLRADALAACLRRGAEEVRWHERWQPPEVKTGRVRWGLGIGTEMHSSGAYPDIKEQSNAILKMNEDGTVQLLTGAADLGTGAHTVLAQIAAEELGMPLANIRVVSGDTDMVPFDIGAYASRTTYVAGSAVQRAAAELRQRLLALAGEKLGCEATTLEIRDGEIRRQGQVLLSVAELVRGEGGRPAVALMAQATYEAKVAYSFAAHFAEVEVDTETGMVRVTKVVAVHEIGKAINPLGVEGQIEGGIQQGIGHSLTEDLVLDPETGAPLNAGFVDYKMPLAPDMPEIRVIILEEAPDPDSPFGAKGVGEDPIMAIGPAIANAVYNATGVRFRELPITPDKLLARLREQGETDTA
ncbi:MAG: xanthine dehydrogenase family protein molybdopterin-binding subunit [Caldilineae bacterium]|nr:MAG: xanthine dehydrogenase family protein molybdopterin-binding subunit [Caldilineae bacterium]